MDIKTLKEQETFSLHCGSTLGQPEWVTKPLEHCLWGCRQVFPGEAKVGTGGLSSIPIFSVRGHDPVCRGPAKNEGRRGGQDWVLPTLLHMPGPLFCSLVGVTALTTPVLRLLNSGLYHPVSLDV